MNWKLPTFILLLGMLSIRAQVSTPKLAPQSQNTTNKTQSVKTNLGNDLGQIKIEAEAGNATAQIKLADAYLARNKPADALRWYQTAAINKSAEGMLQYGKLLMTGSKASSKDQEVAARPQDGIIWVYAAATNGNKTAWREMARAKEAGTGCSTNLVEAYAWWILLSESGDGSAHVQMNDLVLKLAAQDIRQGKSLAGEMKAGRWPGLVPQKISNSRVVLKLNGVSLGGPKHFAIINGKTLEENETATIRVKQDKVEITCLKIMATSALVSVAGEDEPRLLKLE